MNVYTHARLHDLAGAIDSLPSLLPAGRREGTAAAAATGTDGRHCPQHVPAGDIRGGGLRMAETAEGGRGEKAGAAQALAVART